MQVVKTEFVKKKVFLFSYLCAFLYNLPGYYFRDDASKIHGAIRNYVADYMKLYYVNDDALKTDKEIQAFREQLISPRSLEGNRGCGMQGVPDFDSIENLSATLSSFIFICSVEHSATNFPQYDQYGFAPNYAAKLNGFPEEQFGSNELNAALPTKREFFSTVKIMKVLTTVLTNNLGQYEKEYMQAMDTKGREAVKRFQKVLKTISEDIDKRNERIRQENAKPDCKVQDYTYTWLNPDKVLNSISI
ncbi:allene oxide synthase-lipoxygenase protein-like [Saccostrea echinata]|uniref:allene oxide synthase-lipoxygenase protein-like n=1 Tax=Saccostrea echinata TaxID=191078 RepID=UPI002A819221|nr:allene oxide synthase-lipoxygenase protein-like [Saccostrea echinata]